MCGVGVCLLAHGGGLTRFYFDGSIRHLIYGFHDGWYTTQLGLWSLMCHFHASKAISRCPGAEPPPHQCSSAPSVTLATSALARPLQVGHVRPPVVVWRFAIVPGRAVLSPTLVSGGCVPQRAEHASWRVHTAPLATERSRLLDPEVPDYGTVFRCTWKTLTSYNEIPAVVRHFCLDSARGHGAVWNLLTAPTRKFVLTYLLTYLLTYGVGSAAAAVLNAVYSLLVFLFCPLAPVTWF